MGLTALQAEGMTGLRQSGKVDSLEWLEHKFSGVGGIRDKATEVDRGQIVWKLVVHGKGFATIT